MKIKDIVNRSIVNLTNCDQEPIHIPGTIQPHGFLIAMHADSLIIDYCSANVADFTGFTHEQCLGKHFSEIFDPGLQERFLTHINSAVNAVNPPLTVTTFGKSLLCSGYRIDKYYVAEFEPADPNAPDIATIYNQTIQFVGFMEQSDTLQQLCQRVAEQTRAITGYDRVMVYRFDKDYNGEVFAESRIDTVEPFLGLHYPHTDIPAQARQLYLTNLMRIIVDVNYQPVPIFTIDDATGKDLDLSRSYLRSVSPIHIQYLNNMGVGGTLTISLIHEGRLWGLITCHHYSARYVPLYSRIAAQMQGHFLTSQINVRQLSEEYKMTSAINASLEKLLDKTPEATPESFDAIAQDPALLRLCNAGGAAIIFEGIVYANGQTPGTEEIKELSYWLRQHSKHGELSTSRLADIYPAAKNFASTGAGIIYHTLSGLQNDAIIWFAPESQEEVHWGGDPSLAIVKNEKGLSPRKSFELWKQRLQYQSREWRNPELLATATYAHALQKHITLILISEEERKQRLLSQQLQEANTELENINWISSHDLREPLRKIQLFSSKLLDKELLALSETGIASLKKVSSSAGKMQQLLTDITTYNKVRHIDNMFETISLNALLDDVLDELKDDIADAHATVTHDKLPSIYGAEFLLRQLLLNLLRNALKFARKDVAPHINIRYKPTPVTMQDDGRQLYHKIEIEDNGIGFDNKYAEDIFRIFNRLHRTSEYEGTGVGLSLCRKIMQNHNGTIIAHGQPNAGACFTLYFPV